MAQPLLVCDRCGRILARDDIFLSVVSEKHSVNPWKDALLHLRYSVVPAPVFHFCGDCVQAFIGGTRLDTK